MSHYDEILRPACHITPSPGWVNDPNGPVFHNGLYHLYYQYNPVVPVHENIRWGHSTSPDLVEWTAREVAISPSTDLDRDGVYSGMTVLDGDRVVAYFSGFRKDRRYQPVQRAESLDGGFTFGQAVQVVDEPDEALGVDEYRDPFVWREGEGWRMLVGCALPDNLGGALLYESSDQREWSYQGVFASAHARDIQLRWGVDSGNMWEVPQLVRADGVSFLIVSAFRRGTGPMRVFVVRGEEEGNAFPITDCRYLDDGPDFFAASVLTTPDGRTLTWGWGRESLRVPIPMESWSGTLTFPRELRRRPDGNLGSWPARELKGLRLSELPVSAEGDLRDIPRSFEFVATVSLMTDASSTVELGFGSAGQGVRVTVDGRARTVVVDPAGAYTAAVIDLPDDSESVELRWFLDRSISELFTEGGGVATHRIYPPEDGEWSIQTSGDVLSARLWAIGVPGD